MLLVRNRRAVDIDRHFPAKSLIKTVILGGGGQVFIAPYHMGDSHQMVVHHIREIIGRISVRLNKDHIIQLRIVHGNVSVNIVVEGRLSLLWIILADDKRHPGL